MKIALATCRVLPEPDPDQLPLLLALREAGADAELLAWDDPAAPDPSDFDRVVLRSTWNYPSDPARFQAWVERTATLSDLWNRIETVRWNLHKRYLLEVEAAGFPVVPTVLVESGSPRVVADEADARGWEDVVIKPAVSAGSYQTRRFRLSRGEGAAAQSFVDASLRRGDMLIQPYLAAFERSEERAHVWIDGVHDHCVHKSLRFAGADEKVSPASAPDDDERDLFARLIDALPRLVREGMMYGRVDVIRDDDGALRICEVELVEPSLFLIEHLPAMKRLVDAILRGRGNGDSR